jgi:hypothetical protein
MNCLLESVAGVYIAGMRFVAPQSLLPDSDEDDAPANLESCLASLHGRENELMDGIAGLAKEAIQCKRTGDKQGAMNRMQERRRYMKRVDRLRSSSQLIMSQLDLLRNQQLDRELMHSLKLSANTLKKSGATLQVKTAEDVMSEFEEQFHEVNELSSVLSKPIAIDDFDFEFEAELAELEAEAGIASEKPKVESSVQNLSNVQNLPDVPVPSFERPSVAPSHSFARPTDFARPTENVGLVTPVRAVNHMVAS